MHSADLLVRALDAIGTFVFALSGALMGVRRRMDLFGVLVLAFVTAVFGGITRDVLIGAVPPAAIADWHALALSMAAGLLTFAAHAWLEKLAQPVLLFDAAGLGVFAVAGTQKAMDHGISWPMAIVLGTISGIGGGMARDVLTASIPTVLLETEIYAVAAIVGGAVLVGGESAGVAPTVSAATGAALCFGLRVVAVRRGWKLPVAGGRADRLAK